ncbi:MAG: class B sortase [Bacillota bacterium]|nr:class B sortase [Bacillota bacterium]
MFSLKPYMAQRRFLTLLFAGIVAVSFGAIAYRLYQQALTNSAIEEAQALFNENNTFLQNELKEDHSKAREINPPIKKEVTPAIAALQDINPEVVGWIRIAETAIDYPIVQGSDNQYYLDHDWKKEKNRSGAIFMDYRNDPDALTNAETHTILYGHHMRDGSMFKQLVAYKDPAFLKDHPLILIQDQYETHYYEIFSVYVSTSDFYYIETNFATPMDYVMFIKQLQTNSMHQSDQLLTSHDRLLTLSTCTYEYNDARFVVHARHVDHLPKKGS